MIKMIFEKIAEKTRDRQKTYPNATVDSGNSVIKESQSIWEREKETEDSIPTPFGVDATGNKAQDLMVLVGKAIDEWAAMYGMSDLPKHIIFKQALGIMEAWNNIYFKTKR